MSTPVPTASLTGLRLSATFTDRLDAICLARGERRTQFIRRAVVEALDREEAAAIAITPAQAKQLAILAQLAELDVDVDGELIAIRDRLSASGPVVVAG